MYEKISKIKIYRKLYKSGLFYIKITKSGFNMILHSISFFRLFSETVKLKCHEIRIFALTVKVKCCKMQLLAKEKKNNK